MEDWAADAITYKNNKNPITGTMFFFFFMVKLRKCRDYSTSKLSQTVRFYDNGFTSSDCSSYFLIHSASIGIVDVLCFNFKLLAGNWKPDSVDGYRIYIFWLSDIKCLCTCSKYTSFLIYNE